MPRPTLSVIAASRASAGDLFTWDWNSTSTPAGLTLARTGTVYQISNSAQTALQSFGANTWDYEIGGTGAVFVYVLPGYTNLLTSPHAYSGADGNWTASLGTYASFTGTGPDGSTLSGNHRATLTAGQTGAYYSYGSDTTLAFSAWARTPSGSSTWYPALEHSSNGLLNVPGAVAITTAWSRGVLLSGAAKYVVPAESNVPTGSHAQDVVLDFLQAVQGLTFAPPHTDTSVGMKVLSLAGSNVVCGTGYFDVSITGVISLEDESAGASDRYVLYLDANNHLKIRASDNKWVLTIGGAVVISASLGYGAQDLGEIRVWSRGDSCGFEFPSLGDPANTTTAQAPISVPATSYLFSDGSTSASVWPVKLYGADVSGAPCVARNV